MEEGDKEYKARLIQETERRGWAMVNPVTQGDLRDCCGGGLDERGVFLDLPRRGTPPRCGHRLGPHACIREPHGLETFHRGPTGAWVENAETQAYQALSEGMEPSRALAEAVRLPGLIAGILQAWKAKDPACTATCDNRPSEWWGSEFVFTLRYREEAVELRWVVRLGTSLLEDSLEKAWAKVLVADHARKKARR